MPTFTIRFRGSLNDFLPQGRRDRWLDCSFEAPPGLRDRIQALGVPHTEVDLIQANGRSVGLDYRLLPGDRIEVFGLDRPVELAGQGGLIPAPPDPPRFVLDGHLGRLARYLRMLGLDSLYDHAAQDGELARLSFDENRILLTRDRGLLKRSLVRHGYLIRDDDPRRQLADVAARFRLARLAAPFTRCMRCNGAIRPADRSEVAGRLAGEPRTLRYFDTFGQCEDCGSIYWPGSHFDRMSLLVQEVLRPGSAIDENRPDRQDQRSGE